MVENKFPEAVQRCGGDLELLLSTAAIVAEDAPLTLEKLEEAIDSGDREQSKMSAHTLKGMLATFAEKGKAVSCLQVVENAAGQEDLNVAKLLLSNSRADIEHLIADIDAFVESNTAT